MCCANCSDSSQPFTPGGVVTPPPGEPSTEAVLHEGEYVIPVLHEDPNTSRPKGW